ncbi:MAG TPA: glycosyltransferase [Chitinophagaceae bacterium]|nr:glycosyltransferase [Chitinophagaceae bacterium]
MNQHLMEKSPGKSRILVAPLDWGLGHATRCIPIIRELQVRGCEVWLAGEGAQEHLLKEEFPLLPFLQLDGYRIRYSRSAVGLVLSIFRQTHKILAAIKKENAWLKKMIAEYDFDGVISDNRFGLYHASIPCIFITHQLAIKSPLGKWSEKILQKRNYRFINRFTTCWAPDMEGENNLAAELSHPEKKPNIPVKYIGPLSRFDSSSPPTGGDGNKNGHLLIILSGPEPQRSILENKIVKEISHYNGTATIVRGIPGSPSLIPSTNMIQFYNHLPADELKNEIFKAEYIIGRCGYSTVMDLVALQKKSILIPTPGQTEQEYLSSYLFQKQIAFCISQKEFSLNDSLAKAKQYTYHFPEVNTGQLLQQTVSNFISSLSKE